MMKRSVIAYCRVSTDKQMDGVGIDQQRASIIAYALAHGITIDEWAIEHASGTIEEREIIQRVLARCQAQEVQTVIFDRPDRIGRTLAVSENLFRAFKDTGVDVRFTSTTFDDSPSGTFFRQIMAALAEFDRSSWLQRMSQCRRAAGGKNGTYSGGGQVYGYLCLGKGQLAIDPATAPLVARTLELAEEAKSLSDIARILNAEGFRTRKGTALFAQQVKRIIARKAFYQGQALLHNSVTLEPGIKPAHKEININTACQPANGPSYGHAS